MTTKQLSGRFSFEEIMKSKELKKSIQRMLLTNDKLTSRMFEILADNNKPMIDTTADQTFEAYKRYVEQAIESIKKNDGRITNQEFADLIFSLYFKTTTDNYADHRTICQLLELVALNTIEVKRSLNELLLTLTSDDSKKAIARITRDMKFDEKEYRKRMKAVKDSMRIAKWWSRRLNDMTLEKANNERI